MVFPTALMTGLTNRSSPDGFRHRLYPGAALGSPIVTFQAGGGIGVDAPDGHGRLVKLPGYNHLDVLTAAAKQNNGKPGNGCRRIWRRWRSTRDR